MESTLESMKQQRAQEDGRENQSFCQGFVEVSEENGDSGYGARTLPNNDFTEKNSISRPLQNNESNSEEEENSQANNQDSSLSNLEISESIPYPDPMVNNTIETRANATAENTDEENKDSMDFVLNLLSDTSERSYPPFLPHIYHHEMRRHNLCRFEFPRSITLDRESSSESGMKPYTTRIFAAHTQNQGHNIELEIESHRSILSDIWKSQLDVQGLDLSGRAIWKIIYKD